MPLRRYADFSGRSRRMEFWMFRLFFYLVLVFFGLVMLAGIPWAELDRANRTAPPDMGTLFWTGVAGLGLWYLGCIVPSIAVCVRRFHDQDKSGWMWLLYFIPYIGWIIIVVFMCLEGTRGDNQFGPDPMDPDRSEVFS